jgi:hypothetical protein
MPIPKSTKIINGRTVTANDPNQTATKILRQRNIQKALKARAKARASEPSKERQRNQAKLVSAKYAAVQVRKKTGDQKHRHNP